MAETLTTFKMDSRIYLDELKKRHEDVSLHGLPLPEGGIRNAFKKLRIGEVTIIGGYEGHGKSALASQIAFYLADLFEKENYQLVAEGKPKKLIAYVTLEMGWDSLMARAVYQTQNGQGLPLMDPEDIQQEDWPRIEEALQGLKNLPIIINDSARTKSVHLNEMVEDLKAEGDVKFMVVDYLQLMADRVTTNTDEKLDNIVRDLLELARRQKMHILAISSMNRDKNSGAMPTAANLRGSGAMAFHAHNVALLYKPRDFDHNVDEAWKDVALLDLNKSRNSAKGLSHLKWDGNTLTFQTLAPHLRDRLPPLATNNNKWG
jgi:replicative DNA helicase